MNTEDSNATKSLLHREITERIIGAFYEVHRELGHGFIESIYAKALAIALQSSGLRIDQQWPVQVAFRGQSVGEFKLDLVVEKVVVVETKAVSGLVRAHEAQLLNYLKATGLRVGLLLNFGATAEFSRKIL